LSHPRGRDPEAFALLVADIFEAAGVLRSDGERVAASAGQTQARWQLLSVVSAGDWTVPMAADRLGTSRQAVQRLANDLVDDGLAAFANNPRHRRSPLLHLTEEGQRVLDVITAQARRRQKVLVAKLDDVDLVEMRSALRHLVRVMRSELEPRRGPAT
jgi:DNA-binding MarR family transcriptional regulator